MTKYQCKSIQAAVEGLTSINQQLSDIELFVRGYLAGQGNRDALVPHLISLVISGVEVQIENFSVASVSEAERPSIEAVGNE